MELTINFMDYLKGVSAGRNDRAEDWLPSDLTKKYVRHMLQMTIGSVSEEYIMGYFDGANIPDDY